ncbi:hypothetical protein JYP49_14200 [Nitratireductor aquimarinus]|uniref:hypothetical protein n=1 Tax=Nitratireductor TaxID=245876 RepID=UPI0019D36009|nr:MULTISPECIES: hypothetical protein [Nitratireductor]MBN7777749.1 hypothetical protein [Nitratireductor pacificus]MBN7781743.1 hypothetical protein [Nitratireductor pacificus]MBN7790549.1 hypothetical protein [Nitratireductor aquimarinus]MBY6099959.1 hypothetical protein [Nitratireductor aquimarinus]MCA1260425.1 hypothetical protein [Nitratireductor aquimarinus]
MIEMKSGAVSADLTKQEAKEISQRIRDRVEDIRKLVARAHDGKAWKALGYKTWEAYVKAEFGMSRVHAHRLMKQGEVLEAIEEAVGDSLPMGNISERVTRELKADLPAAVEEIKERAEKGEDPALAAKDIAAKKRAEKEKAKAEKAEKQAELDRQREQNAAALPDSIKHHEARKQEAIAARQRQSADDGLSPEDRLAELEEANRLLEEENAALKETVAKFSKMEAEYKAGGFEEIIAGKDEEIRVLETRLYRESEDKASWMKSSKFWKAEAIKLGYSNDVVIDIETGEVVNG